MESTTSAFQIYCNYVNKQLIWPTTCSDQSGPIVAQIMISNLKLTQLSLLEKGAEAIFHPPQGSEPIFHAIRSVMNDLQKLNSPIILFKGQRGDKAYNYLEEMITKCHLALDKIECQGIPQMIDMRKHARQNVDNYESVLNHICDLPEIELEQQSLRPGTDLTLDAINKVEHQIENLTPSIKLFNGTRDDQTYKFLDNELTCYLEALDSISIRERPDMKQKRISANNHVAKQSNTLEGICDKL